MAINVDDPRPPYVQLADALRKKIDSGELRPGQRLPSGRELAREYGIAGMTVQKAVDQLRADDWVFTRPGIGTFVRERPPTDGTRPPAADTITPEELYDTIVRQLDAMQTQLTEMGQRVTELEKAVKKPPR